MNYYTIQEKNKFICNICPEVSLNDKYMYFTIFNYGRLNVRKRNVLRRNC